MTTPNNGGAAFPVPEIRADGIGIREGWDGMSLRDYFAARAMQSFVSRWAGHDSHDEAGVTYIRAAQHAYAMADAMLKARALSNIEGAE